MANDLQGARIRVGSAGLNGGGVTTGQLTAAVADRAANSASFITRVAESGLSNETALASLTTGILKVTTGTGNLTTAAGADLPAHTHSGVTGTIPYVIDGGGAVITTGGKGYLRLPFGGTWTSWTVLGEQVSGLIQVDIWKSTYASYPPTGANTIAGTDKPRIVATGNKATSSALTGWNTTFNAGDIIGFNVDSVTSMVKVVIYLDYVRTI